jgi:glutamyl/glutaminyl-tRNA synthetase
MEFATKQCTTSKLRADSFAAWQEFAMSRVRTRFAPSPTGYMHIGAARTAIFAWAYAKNHDGDFLLRIEDTDKSREVEGSIKHIQESLEWLGINWDEGPGEDSEHGPYLQ